MPDFPPCYTVKEYCEAYRVSKSQLYLEWRQGKGPRRYRRGTKVFISAAAAAEHQRELENGDGE
jgi:hypothetical protein